MKVKIALLVGDNGEFNVTRFEGEETDWAWLTDVIGKFNKQTGEVTYPTSERRYIIEAEVDLPTPPTEITAKSVEEVVP